MDSNIVAALIGAVATVAAAVITIVYARKHDYSPKSKAQAMPAASVGAYPDLDDILARLELHRQRATFGAVAGLLGREPLGLLEGYTRTQRTSWLVNKTTGKPTGQDNATIHPGLFKNPHVIKGSVELKAWLAAHSDDVVNRVPGRVDDRHRENVLAQALLAPPERLVGERQRSEKPGAQPGAINSQAVQSLKRLLDRLSAQPPGLSESDWNLDQIIAARSKVVPRFGTAFSAQNTTNITREAFIAFLQFENNCHWHGLDRSADIITSDMNRLRKALALLVDESVPLKDRLQRLRPRGQGDGSVPRASDPDCDPACRFPRPLRCAEQQAQGGHGHTWTMASQLEGQITGRPVRSC